MKMLVLVLVMFLVGVVHAQAVCPGTAVHCVTTSWSDGDSSLAGIGYNVYRTTGSCTTPLPTMTKLNTTPITPLTYTDTAVGPGVYCYYVTATLNSAESAPSSTVQATILPKAPSGVTQVVQ